MSLPVQTTIASTRETLAGAARAAGIPCADWIVGDANQEHGIITVRPGSGSVLPDLAIGDRVRILPNHACATSAQHRAYHVVRGTSDRVESEWVRFGGWQ